MGIFVAQFWKSCDSCETNNQFITERSGWYFYSEKLQDIKLFFSYSRLIFNANAPYFYVLDYIILPERVCVCVALGPNLLEAKMKYTSYSYAAHCIIFVQYGKIHFNQFGIWKLKCFHFILICLFVYFLLLLLLFVLFCSVLFSSFSLFAFSIKLQHKPSLFCRFWFSSDVKRV